MLLSTGLLLFELDGNWDSKDLVVLVFGLELLFVHIFYKNTCKKKHLKLQVYKADFPDELSVFAMLFSLFFLSQIFPPAVWSGSDYYVLKKVELDYISLRNIGRTQWIKPRMEGFL